MKHIAFRNGEGFINKFEGVTIINGFVKKHCGGRNIIGNDGRSIVESAAAVVEIVMEEVIGVVVVLMKTKRKKNKAHERGQKGQIKKKKEKRK